MWAAEHGTHLVSLDGTECASALPDGPPWRPLKLLASQTLPLLAALRGREVLHAAGVVVGERLIGVVAASGTGKSATTCNLIAQGGRFFADDVLAMEAADGRVWAHPGTRLLNLFAHDLDAIPEDGQARLGERLGVSDKVHFVPDGFPTPMPLSGLVFLSRGRAVAATAPASVEHATSQLLGNAFLRYLDSAPRLAGQLEVMSVLARTTPRWGRARDRTRRRPGSRRKRRARTVEARARSWDYLPASVAAAATSSDGAGQDAEQQHERPPRGRAPRRRSRSASAWRSGAPGAGLAHVHEDEHAQVVVGADARCSAGRSRRARRARRRSRR